MSIEFLTMSEATVNSESQALLIGVLLFPLGKMVDSKVDGQINTLNHIYPHIAKVSGNTSAEETKAIYDEWSSTYDEVSITFIKHMLVVLKAC